MSLKPQPIDFDAKWPGLEETVRSVLTMGNIKHKVWAEKFSDVYALCIAHPEPLSDRLYLEIKNLLESHVRNLCRQVNEKNEDLLSEYYKHWEQYSKGTHYLNNLFTYLNTQHIQNHRLSDADVTYGSMTPDVSERMQEIGELALDIWLKEMIQQLKSRLINIILLGIKHDREGIMSELPTTTLRGVIMSFVLVNTFKKKSCLQLYETLFEEELLRETGDFYRAEAASLLQSCTVSHYMEKVIARLEDEKLRATKFLPSSSHQRMLKEVQSRMVADHLNTLHGEASSMVAAESAQDLSNMYALLKGIPGGIMCLVREVQEHIKQKGLQAIASLEGENVPAQYVENLLEVHHKYVHMIQTLFHNDQQFIGALDKAFESIVNHRIASKNVSRSPELLAKYCDTLLKKSSKGISEAEVDRHLSESITIFKYVDDKDVYQKFYSRNLAKRLIHQLSQSMDSEEAMINKLKQACGYEYTSKLHRMLTDIKLSADYNQEFHAFLKQQNIDLGISFSINVLQAGSWPIGLTASGPFNIPQELEKSVQAFEYFYHKKFSGRKLTWLHHLCQGELKCNHTKRTYLISMSTLQMAMMLLFEKTDSVTCAELQSHTGLNDEQFTRFLQSLLDSKLLLNDAKDLKGDDVVVNLNLDFTNKRTKFKINIVSQKETQQEVEQTHTSVDEDRKIYIQAAIVRIMKARKITKHNLLIQEVISQSKGRFTPQIPMIKKCIEVLIDKQYLERVPDTTDEYSYVA